LVMGFDEYSASKREPKLPVGEPKALNSLSFKVDNTNSLYMCTMFGKVLVVILLLISLGLVCIGVYLDSFYFEFKGAAEVLSNFGSQTHRTYSIVTLGLTLPYTSAVPNSAGIRLIQITFFLFTLLVPLVHFLVLLFLWLIPLKPRAQRTIFDFSEILNAWSSIEVFVISIIAAILEIQQFVAFIVGDKCSLINELISKYAHGEFTEDKCFDVVANLSSGCWILFVACVIYLITGNFVMRICHSTVEQRSAETVLSLNSEQEQDKCGQCKCGCLPRLGQFLRIIVPDEKSHPYL